jgi:prepilin-type N-terminal cleavage/methylation domain-containing protein
MMGKTKDKKQTGFTLVELTVAMFVLSVIALSVLGLFTSLVKSALYTKRKAVALTLSTNQMEYLKSLSYDSLAVAGGSIFASSPLPASKTQAINGVTYTIKTTIDYIDDAYDGCGSYPTTALKLQYCRNYPPPTGAPVTDLNAADYKIIHVSTYDSTNTKLAEVDTQVSARVAETASTTGALFVSVIDGNGNPIAGATVQVTDTSLTPNVTVSDSTDINGTAIFYGLPPDTSNYDYVVTASYSGYSTLATISPSGSLQPNYSSQQIFTQLSSFVTLTIKPQGTYSLIVETTDTSGAVLGNAKLYIKGGYKKYTLTTNTTYYYDNLTPSDTRPVTDSNGITTLTNLVPGAYIFCGDIGATSCSVGGTTYYLTAAVPYSGANPFNPVTVPTYLASSPPATTFPFSGNSYLQKVRLMLSNSSTFPRVVTMAPDEVSLASSTISAFLFQITGVNLPCSSTAASCSTVVRFLQGASTYTASCTGNSSGLTLNCSVNLTGATAGQTQLVVISGGKTLTLPGAPLLGGISVTP